MPGSRKFVHKETGQVANNYAMGRSIVTGQMEIVETDDEGRPTVVESAGSGRWVAVEVDD